MKTNSNEILDDELLALHKFVDSCAGEMKKRLIQKYYDGFRGWDNPDFRQQLKARALDAILQGKFIDAMNMCGMVYNIDQILKDQEIL